MSSPINRIICLLFLTQLANAEPTPPGGTATFTNQNGSFTYYFVDGTAAPAGTRVFFGMDGRGGVVLDAEGRSTGTMVYETKEAATAAAKYTNQSSTCGGFVVGPSLPDPKCSSSASKKPKSEAEYKEFVYELAITLYGAKEIGPNCSAFGEKIPASMSAWWKAVNTYLTGEVARDKALLEATAAVQKKMQAFTTSKTEDMQKGSIELQIESVDVSINSVQNGRIPLREALLLAALKSIESASEENKTSSEAWFNMRDTAIPAAIAVAKAACERKKKVQKCEKDENGNDKPETCEEVEENDPVPGCEVILSEAPILQTSDLQYLGETYLDKLQSTKQNDQIKKIGDAIEQKLAGFPRSDDPKYDWSTPMETAQKSLMKAVKNSGIKCPSGEDVLQKLEDLEKELAKKDSEKNKDLIENLNKELNDEKTVVGRISRSADSFMASLGIPADVDVKKGYIEAWKTADTVIGQGHNRHEYFDYVVEKTNALLAYDREKLSQLLAAREKLVQYLEKLNKALGGDTKGGNGAVIIGESPIGNTPKKPIEGGNGENGDNGINKEIVGGTIAPSFDTSTGSFANAVNVREFGEGVAAIDSSGGSTGNLSNSFSDFNSNFTNATDGLSLGSQAMATAKKSQENITKNQKRVLAKATNSLASNSNRKNSANENSKSGSSKTTLSNTSNANSFKNKMEGLTNELRSSGVFRKNNASNVAAANDTEKNITKSASVNKKQASKIPSKFLGSSSSSSSSSNSENDKNKEDKNRLNESIQAYKLQSADYEVESEDTIFDRITKAYIRNYERVSEEYLEE